MDSIRATQPGPPTPLACAHERLAALEKTARTKGDEATLSVAACARAIEQAVPEAPDARLRILEEAMRAIEAAPASTVGMQAQVAKGILDKVDSAWPTLAARHDGARRAVETLADRAEVTHAPEARNARFLADMASFVESPESMLSPMKDLEGADVDRLSWYVGAARSGALGGIMTVGERARGARAVKMGLDEIRRHGGDAHLERMEAWQERVESPYTRLFIRFHTLDMIDKGVPHGAEAGLVLAQKVGRWGKLPPQDKAVIRQAAVDEALPAAAPGTDLRCWLDFHQAARDIPHAEPMLDMVLYCVMWGASPEPAMLDFAAYETLRALSPDPQNCQAIFQAFDTLTPGSGWQETIKRYTALADRCTKAAPEWEGPMLEQALQGARKSEKPAVRLLLDVFDRSPASGADRSRRIRETLDQIARVGDDPMQDALTSDPAPVGGVTVDDDYVTIGTLRIPRRAVTG